MWKSNRSLNTGLGKCAGFGFLLLFTACGHVPQNYPPIEKPPRSWIKTTAPARWSNPVCTVEVGEKSDSDERAANRAEVLDQMAKGMGKKAVDRMVENYNRQSPSVGKLLELSSQYYLYRGTIVFHQRKEIKINKGFFSLTFVAGGDTITVPDEGIIFINHGDNKQHMFSSSGLVVYSPELNRLPLGWHNRILVASTVEGRIVDISPSDSN